MDFMSEVVQILGCCVFCVCVFPFYLFVFLVLREIWDKII